MPYHLLLVFIFLTSASALSQADANTNTAASNKLNRLILGIELGELPVQGSFKPGINLGYQLNNDHEIFISYQIQDDISRNGESFNSRNTGIEGQVSSNEKVAHRAQLLGLWRGSWSPLYFTYGLVYNGKDSEYMHFQRRQRQILNQQLNGPIAVSVVRKAGLSPAIGLGVSGLINNTYQVFAQWSGNIFQQPADPSVVIHSAEMTAETKSYLTKRIKTNFNKKITNVYHVFSMGVRF